MGDKNHKIFFSWQSDLDKAATTNFIRNAIKFSKKELESKNKNIKFTLDEATRDLTGSPHIPNSIFNKILNSDIFICDITTINNDDKVIRKTPNPNVLIELGFAAAILGWNRIIMLFNESFGDFNIETPFDLEKRRITLFSHKNGAGDKYYLGDVLTYAINLIVINNPEKFVNTLNKPEKEKRSRDIKSLKQFLNFVHIPSFDEYFSRLPKWFSDRMLGFYEFSNVLVRSNSFYIYDDKLSSLIHSLYNHWSILFSFDGRYDCLGTSKDCYVFITPGDIFPTPQHEYDWKKIEEEKDKMKKVFQDLLDYIRKEYQEIDLNVTSENAIKEYIKFEKRVEKKIKLDDKK